MKGKITNIIIGLNGNFLLPGILIDDKVEFRVMSCNDGAFGQNINEFDTYCFDSDTIFQDVISRSNYLLMVNQIPFQPQDSKDSLYLYTSSI